ncbi:hypothetical protein HK096_000183 [Nowakowskiella sp. JEL0078]|nr:hypothetical protein HK096_000183 [Nowakowskiella sp. JEL0078]
MRSNGETPPVAIPHLQETKFWKVTGNMKVYKNTSNGVRHRTHPVRYHLHKGSSVKRLSFGKRSTGGRNDSGRITVRGRGGGHKRRVRNIDFKRTAPGPHMVVRLEYDPNRSAELALLRNLSTNEFSYILRQKDLNVGDVVYSWRSGLPIESSSQTEENVNEETVELKKDSVKIDQHVSKSRMIQRGNCLPLHAIPVGTIVSCISLKPNGPAKLCRSAGTYGQLLALGTKVEDRAPGKLFAQLRLQSKEVRLVDVNCVATIGEMGNSDHHNRVLGKAGLMRHKGFRPKVRGIAMSPYDHPHGGGRKSKGGRHPRSPWGWKTRGLKTVRGKKWFVVTPKWKVKMDRGE